MELTSLLLTGAWPAYRYGLPVVYIALFLPAALILTSGEQRQEVANVRV